MHAKCNCVGDICLHSDSGAHAHGRNARFPGLRGRDGGIGLPFPGAGGFAGLPGRDGGLIVPGGGRFPIPLCDEDDKKDTP